MEKVIILFSEDNQKFTVQHSYGNNGNAIYRPATKDIALQQVSDILNGSQPQHSRQNLHEHHDAPK
jgi:hypothetical protein